MVENHGLSFTNCQNFLSKNLSKIRSFFLDVNKTNHDVEHGGFVEETGKNYRVPGFAAEKLQDQNNEERRRAGSVSKTKSIQLPRNLFRSV